MIVGQGEPWKKAGCIGEEAVGTTSQEGSTVWGQANSAEGKWSDWGVWNVHEEILPHLMMTYTPIVLHVHQPVDIGYLFFHFLYYFCNFFSNCLLFIMCHTVVTANCSSVTQPYTWSTGHCAKAWRTRTSRIVHISILDICIHQEYEKKYHYIYKWMVNKSWYIAESCNFSWSQGSFSEELQTPKFISWLNLYS